MLLVLRLVVLRLVVLLVLLGLLFPLLLRVPESRGHVAGTAAHQPNQRYLHASLPLVLCHHHHHHEALDPHVPIA